MEPAVLQTAIVFAYNSIFVIPGVYRAEAFQLARFNKSKLSQEDVVHVCMTSDVNTIGGMIALINSIYQNTKHPVMFHLVVDEQSVVHLR